MKVYVVSIGEKYEGSDVEDIFISLEAARKFALEYIKKFTKFIEVHPNYWDEWSGENRQLELGCEWVEIKEWEVKE